MDELRPFTYLELFERRDEVRFPGQMFPLHLNKERQAVWEDIKLSGTEAYKLRKAQEDSENEVERMTDEELLDLVSLGGVVVEKEDIDELVKEQMEKEDEFEARLNDPNAQPIN